MVQRYKINCKYEKYVPYIFFEILKRCRKKLIERYFYCFFEKMCYKIHQNIFLFKIFLLPLQTLS